MKTLLLASLLVTLATPALAQHKADEHAAHRVAATTASPVTDLAEGEIRKVDREARKLTIRHGEIRNLEMPPMTMVFHVKDASVLDRVKPGDKVRFAAQKAASGLEVTHIETVK